MISFSISSSGNARCTRLFRGRRAQYFNLLVVVFTIMILTYAFVRLSAKVESPPREIGEVPFENIAKIQEGEKALIFMDFASEMALYQAVYDIYGSSSADEDCGSYFGFRMWNSADGKTCFMDSDEIEDALKERFVTNIIARTSAYPNADFMGSSSEIVYSRGESLYTSGEIDVGGDAS